MRQGFRSPAISHTIRVIAIFSAFIAAGTSAHAGILNGSFENTSNNFADITDYHKYTNPPSNGELINNWATLGGEVIIVGKQFTFSPITGNSQDGNFWIDLTGAGSNFAGNGVSQDVSTTIGQKYELSFYVGSATGYEGKFSTVDLSIDGGARVGYQNSNTASDHVDWKLMKVQFTATNSTTNISFFNGNTVLLGNNFVPDNFNDLCGLDDVSLVEVRDAGNGNAVPEPASMALVGMGIVSLVSYRLRSRRQK